jgi:hypothetical protein
MASPDNETQDDYISQRQMVAERFAALGGGETIEMSLSKMPKLKDLVTDSHRAMVKDLTAGGMSHESIARVMGISKSRLQDLFDYELAVGFELAESSLARSMYLSGVAGNSTAATNWLRYHKKSQWSDKKEMTDKGASQEKDIDQVAIKTANDLLLKALIEGISGSENLVRAPSKAHSAPVVAAKVSPKKTVKAVMKKPRIEDDKE